ncbi:MAG: hypothetical protein BEN18_04200 [Epulopiscium sp. Nuni2H_MBin001]|nr:MAG: hypothetical protein BEN18_04200 [Epulopiscium sp. Nuni2H_MBin001]
MEFIIYLVGISMLITAGFAYMAKDNKKKIRTKDKSVKAQGANVKEETNNIINNDVHKVIEVDFEKQDRYEKMKQQYKRIYEQHYNNEVASANKTTLLKEVTKSNYNTKRGAIFYRKKTEGKLLFPEKYTNMQKDKPRFRAKLAKHVDYYDDELITARAINFSNSNDGKGNNRTKANVIFGPRGKEWLANPKIKYSNTPKLKLKRIRYTPKEQIFEEPQLIIEDKKMKLFNQLNIFNKRKKAKRNNVVNFEKRLSYDKQIWKQPHNVLSFKEKLMEHNLRQQQAPVYFTHDNEDYTVIASPKQSSRKIRAP